MSKPSPERPPTDDLFEFVGALVRAQHALPVDDQQKILDAVDRALDVKHAPRQKTAKPAKRH